MIRHDNTPRPSRSRFWCFTLNNPASEDETHIIETVGSRTNYLVFGREIASTGTRHLQGYLELPVRARFGSVKKLFGRLAPHLEPRRGTSNQASSYCKKDGDFHEQGIISVTHQGTRTDLEALRSTINTGANIAYVADVHFGCFLKYERSIRSYMSMHVEPRKYPPCIIVYWGKTGTGKTKAFWDNIENLNDVWLYPGKEWFDGYAGQPFALFDEFSGSQLGLPLLLKVLDRYPLQVPTKGGHTWFQPCEIYLTSNLNPSDWYPNAHDEHRNALFRRLTNVVYFE